jgi:hypothetical protein
VDVWKQPKLDIGASKKPISRRFLRRDQTGQSDEKNNMLNFVKDYLAKREGKNEYQAALQKFLADGKLESSEKTELDKLAAQYGFSREDLLDAHKKATSAMFSGIASDERITDEEKGELEVLMNYFDLKPADFDFNQATFNKYYSLALIDKGILPTPQHSGLNVIFKEDETIHWLCGATLKKHKRVTERINYSGITGSVNLS